MSNHTALNVIKIAEPCSESWDQMNGDSRTRFCTHCQRHVHDLSMMSADDAEQLLCESAGKLCVRFNQAPDGSVVTLDYQPRLENRRTWRFWGLVGACAAAIAGIGYAIHVVRKPPPTCQLMGSAMVLIPKCDSTPGSATKFP